MKDGMGDRGEGGGWVARIRLIVINHPLPFKGFYTYSISIKSYKLLTRKKSTNEFTLWQISKGQHSDLNF
jgi:hypothetical protein